MSTIPTPDGKPPHRFNFRNLLSEETRRRNAAADEYLARDTAKFANMDNGNLVATAKYYMTQMREPWKHEKATPTYDAVFWHVVIPELLKRVREGGL